MAELEGIGEAVTGAAMARAVEPRGGEAADGHTHEKCCLNCGCELVGDFCHRCGQRAHVHRTIAAWWHDFLHSVLHLDGKFWRTLPMLAFRPGELTRRYAHGERAKFVSPLALFLFSVFMMFAVFTLIGSPMDFSEDAAQIRAEATSEWTAEREEAQRDLAELQQELQEARAGGLPAAPIETRIEGVRTELAAQERAYRLALRVANQEGQREATQPARDETEVNILGETGWPQLDKAIQKAEANPSLLLYKIQANAYKFSWALIPISLPFVWILFLHRRRYRREFGAYDHLIFITYSISFMSLGAIAATLLGWIGLSDGLIWSAVGLVPPIHMFLQLRGSYGLSKWSALWRTLLLVNFTFVTLGLFLTLLLVLGVFG